MGQFVNPFTDIGFKRIFGQEISKPLIIDFLNNLLEGERKITDLSFLDKEIPAQTIDGRSLAASTTPARPSPSRGRKGWSGNTRFTPSISWPCSTSP